MAVRRDEGLIKVPVDLELAVGVLVVGLVRAPAQRFHGRHDLGDDVEAPHQRHGVVARLARRVEGVGDLRINQISS